MMKKKRKKKNETKCVEIIVIIIYLSDGKWSKRYGTSSHHITSFVLTRLVKIHFVVDKNERLVPF